jgi:hypothetical protein
VPNSWEKTVTDTVPEYERPPQCDRTQGAEPNYAVPTQWFVATVVFIASDQLDAMAHQQTVPGPGLKLGIDQSIVNLVSYCHCGNCPDPDPQSVGDQYGYGVMDRLEHDGFTIVSCTGVRLDDKLNVSARPETPHEGFINDDGKLESFGKHGTH